MQILKFKIATVKFTFTITAEGTHQIVMSFSLPVVGCLLKNGLQRGRGGGRHGHPGTPLAIPLSSVKFYGDSLALHCASLLRTIFAHKP